MITYSIHPSKKLVLICMKGRVKPAETIEFINSMASDPDYRIEYNSIVDMRSTDLDYDLSELKDVLIHMASKQGFKGKRKAAYLASKANQVVLPIIMASGEHDLPMETKAHSTVASALEWLKIPDFDEDDYNSFLNGMCDC